MTKKLPRTNTSPDQQRKPSSAVLSKEQHNAVKALAPALNAAAVVEAYQANIIGNEIDFGALMAGLQSACQTTHQGDLRHLESMLMSQAIALQTIFTSLARRAQGQEFQQHFEGFLALALKAQAQSRATIQAVAELKQPRQVAFVNQANISNGPQQVNNHAAKPSSSPPSRARKTKTLQNKLLVESQDGSTAMDRRAAQKTSRSDPTLEAVEPLHRPNKRSR